MNYLNKIGILFLVIWHYSCAQSQDRSTEDSENNDSVIAIWADMNTSNFPNMRSEYAMAYDQFNKKIIAYGGRTGFRSDFQIINETWAFDYSENKWINLNTTNSPPWRSSHVLAYDSKRHKTILFGGNDFDKAFNDLWEYDYNTNKWMEITPMNSPEVRQMHGLIYIEQRDALILFGGRRSDGGAAFSDLWELIRTTNTWKKLNTNVGPGFTDHVNITYNSKVEKVLLYTNSTTWAFDFNTNQWSDLNPTNTPDIGHSSFIYDSITDKSVLFGSGDSSHKMLTWIFDYSTNRWTNITPRYVPNEFTEHDDMVYLNDQNVFIQYGGCCSDLTLELKLRVE